MISIFIGIIYSIIINPDLPPGQIPPIPDLFHWLSNFELCAISAIFLFYLIKGLFSEPFFVLTPLLLLVALGLLGSVIGFTSFQLISTATLIIIAHLCDNKNAPPWLEYVFPILLVGFPALIQITSINLETVDSRNETATSLEAEVNNGRLPAVFLSVIYLFGIGCALLYEWTRGHEKIRKPAPRVGSSINLGNILSRLIIFITSYIPSSVLVFFMLFRGVEARKIYPRFAEIDTTEEIVLVSISFIGPIVGFISYFIFYAQWILTGRSKLAVFVRHVSCGLFYTFFIYMVFKFDISEGAAEFRKGVLGHVIYIGLCLFLMYVLGKATHYTLKEHGVPRFIERTFDQDNKLDGFKILWRALWESNRVNVGIGGAGAAARNNQPQNMGMPARMFERRVHANAAFVGDAPPTR